MTSAPDKDASNKVCELTPREREIAVLIAQGFTMKETAEALKISRFTIRAHITRMHTKLRTSNCAMLAAWCVRAGLADHPEWYDAAGRFVGEGEAA